MPRGALTATTATGNSSSILLTTASCRPKEAHGHVHPEHRPIRPRFHGGRLVHIVDGLTVLMAGDDADGHQVYTVSEGRARVAATAWTPHLRRLTYAAVPDAAPHRYGSAYTADAASTQSGGQRITWPPLRCTMCRGRAASPRARPSAYWCSSFSGAADALPDTAVVSIVECRRVIPYTAGGADYKRTATPWTGPPQATGPPGSAYSTTYECVTSAEPKGLDADSFRIEGAASSTSILITYRQACPASTGWR